MKRTFVFAAALVSLLVIAVGVSSRPTGGVPGGGAAGASAPPCTNATLKGTYLFRVTGVASDGAGNPKFPFSMVGVATLNGQGKGTGKVQVKFGDDAKSGSPSVTYSVSSNCTGKLKLTEQTAPSLNFGVALFSDGREFEAVSTDSNWNVSGTFKRQ